MHSHMVAPLRSFVALLVVCAMINTGAEGAAGNGKHMRVLAFGDSLTEGWTAGGFHPYSTRLQWLLQQVRSDTKVVQRGVSGETVLKRVHAHPSGLGTCMVERLPEVLAKATKSGQKFDWVIIMGGINDVGLGHQGEQIFQGLRRMYMDALRHGAKLIVITCMETASSYNNPKDVHRQRVNQLIREFAAKEEKTGRVFLLDLEKKIRYEGTQEELERIWDDGLHLMPEGYDMVADEIFAIMKDKVSQEKVSQ